MKDLVKPFLEDQYTNTEIAIGYIADGKAYFEGMLKRGKEAIEVENSKALFEIGSITKVFTTTILAQLIIEGKVEGDTLISDILPYKSLKKTGITLKSLANHTSGLPRLPENFYSIKNHDERNPYLNYNEEALIAYLKNIVKQNSKSNANFEYSNLGSGVLGYVISKIENSPFEKVVRDRIFLPLGMQSTSFDTKNKKNSIKGLTQKGEHSYNWEGGILGGCIGIISSVSDMIKFMFYMLDEKNINANIQLEETYKIEDNHHIGLGWGIRTLPDGTKSYNHGGGSDGYSCYMRIHRATQSGVIMLTNISAFNDNQSQVNELAIKLSDELRHKNNASS